MPNIPYHASNFGRYQGRSLQGSNNLSVSWPDIIWASISVGKLDLADVFGYFVETFEEDFKAQSKVDYRDMDVNWYGVMFGDMLEKNKKMLPSQIIIIRSLRYFIIAL